LWSAIQGWTGLDQYDESNLVGQAFLDEYEEAYGRRPEYCAPVMNHDFATVLLHAFADAHPLTPRGVKEALERVKMVSAAAGAPGTRLSFGKWPRRGWMGAAYLVARQLEPEFGKSRLVGRFGDL
jgi:branched-chain amino acid transport system substrate-binding protein